MIESETLIIFADFYEKLPARKELVANPSIKAYLMFGFAVVHVAAANDVSHVTFEEINKSHVVISRPNTGYDFGSWGEAINVTENLSKYKYLVFTNSSLLGPIWNPKHFLDKLLALDSDIKAAVESFQVKPHFQSYFWAIDQSKTQFNLIATFLNSFIGQPPNREKIIRMGEIGITNFLKKNDLTYKTVFPAGSLCNYSDNPILKAHLRLLSHGFPYTKITNLIENIQKQDYCDLINEYPGLEEWLNTNSVLQGNHLV
jgi:hypothetical protein